MNYQQTLYNLSGDGGVTKRIISEGKGEIPSKGSKVFVHFVGTINVEHNSELNKIFLDTTEKAPFSFVIGEEQTIPGLELGVKSMREGEKAILTILSQYGYGDHGNQQGFHSLGNPIPEKATLIFEIFFIYCWPPDEVPIWKLNDTEKISTGKSLKESGNLLFKCQEYFLAMGKYLRAVDFCEGVSNKQIASDLLLSSYLNLSACALNTQQYKDTIKYATKALEIEPNNTKGLFRRGKANLHLRQFDNAKDDLEKASTYSTDSQLKIELTKVKQELEIARKKEKDFYGGLFSKLSGQGEEALYNDKIQSSANHESPTKLCSICNLEIEKVQWARHVIKMHSK